MPYLARINSLLIATYQLPVSDPFNFLIVYFLKHSSDHVSILHKNPQWLLIAKYIRFKPLTLVFKTLTFVLYQQGPNIFGK